jgi:hypothetical protein
MVNFLRILVFTFPSLKVNIIFFTFCIFKNAIKKENNAIACNGFLL